jgi:hypothetical protein
MGENIHVYKVLVGRREGKGPLGKPKGRWKYNINPYPADVENMVSS